MEIIETCKSLMYYKLFHLQKIIENGEKILSSNRNIQCLVPDIDECKANPCQNGGTCSNENGGYSCKCTNGWTGDTCVTG